MIMGMSPGREIMSLDEMIAAETEKAGNRLYSRDTDATEKIRQLVAQATVDLLNMPEKISLRDTDVVQSVIRAYLVSCYSAGTVPSKLGASRAMGISRQAIDDFMRRNPTHPTSQYLMIAFDTFASVLSDSGLTGASNLAVCIFCLKALYSWSDTQKIEIQVPHDPLGTNRSAEEIAEQYAFLPEE